MFRDEEVIVWQDCRLNLIDQRFLPFEEKYFQCNSVQNVHDAIRDMVVRGAPAIGITAAYGTAISAISHKDTSTWREAIATDIDFLAESRPTAVNLFWALRRMRSCLDDLQQGNVVEGLLAEAKAIHQEEVVSNHAMAILAEKLIEPGSGVLTHCNTGSLATGAGGTALGVIKYAYKKAKIAKVFADETRPWLQGSRLTAWELVQAGIPVQLIADGAAAHLMKTGQVQWLIVGSDRILANGDAANKIGTYHAAIAARYHGVKVMFVAPTSTVDMSMKSGDEVVIEERAPQELLSFRGQQIAPEGAGAWNPVFDVTPHAIIDAIVTEKAVVLNPDLEKIKAMIDDR